MKNSLIRELLKCKYALFERTAARTVSSRFVAKKSGGGDL